VICGIRARLGGMSEFPLIGESGLENFVHSRGDVRVRFGQIEKVQQDCPKITEIGPPPLASAQVLQSSAWPHRASRCKCHRQRRRERAYDRSGIKRSHVPDDLGRHHLSGADGVVPGTVCRRIEQRAQEYCIPRFPLVRANT